MTRAFNFQAWFKSAYAPHVPPFEPTQARGALLASSNDEPEPGDLTEKDLTEIDREFGIASQGENHV